ncbi:MAG: hypothetical protein HON94_05135 [Methylococcales bacterium]|nr:hypothetical protein [Methylococcales bacterium]MBT7409130.1 hypothetical protein [Methylococcales bacterium]
MKLNRDVLITAIVKHQRSFLKLLDYIDTHDGSLEFPEMLYIKLYNHEICSETEENNTDYHLSIVSLIENGVFIHNNKNTGMITIERLIVDLLRFLDIKRVKELTDFDFEQLRKRIVDISDDIESLDPYSQNYVDAMKSFNVLMSEIHSKIKENVSGLTAQVDSIAKDYKHYNTGSSDVNVFDLYDRVTTLYVRFVLPCYEFINPEMEMVKTKTFSKAIQHLIEYHSDSGLKRYNVASAIQFRKTAITSYYKNIALLAHKLEQFSNHLEEDRGYFLAIESSFSELIDNLIPLRHGKQRNKYLTADASIFSKTSALEGLSNRRSKYSAKLNWSKETSKLRFKEYLAIIEETKIKEKNKTLVALPATHSVDQDRQIFISQSMNQSEIPDYIPNIHEFIINELQNRTNDFKLQDVLFGLEAFLPRLNEDRILPTLQKQRLTDDTYFFEYLALEFAKETLSV